ncbi:hypothetical protein AAY473_028323 [Plecturocebus cupreus]
MKSPYNFYYETTTMTEIFIFLVGGGFAMLARLIYSWPEMICLPCPPKVGITGISHCTWPEFPSMISRSTNGPLPLPEKLLKKEVSLCRPGWSTLAQSQLIAISASQVQAILRWGFAMLARQVSNSWPQVIQLPQPPKGERTVKEAEARSHRKDLITLLEPPIHGRSPVFFDAADVDATVVGDILLICPTDDVEAQP